MITKNQKFKVLFMAGLLFIEMAKKLRYGNKVSSSKNVEHEGEKSSNSFNEIIFENNRKHGTLTAR